MRTRLTRTLILILLVAVAASAADRITDLRSTVLLVSIDGFRPDYLGDNTPNLDSLADRGVRAKWMIPSFPTKTFPNHYTIVTGLYPEHHGIVANNIWDDTMGLKFAVKDREQLKNSKWWGGEPIWVTAEKQGVVTAPLDWPGSEAAIEDKHPTYYREFDSKMSAEERVTQLLPYFDKPSPERPRFLTLYMDEVDEAGHDFGPGSSEVKEAVAKVDAALGKLLSGLRERGIEDQVNIIVVSDHGMAPTSRKKLVQLDDYVDLKTVMIADWGPPIALRALDGNNAGLLEKLKRIPHAHAYASADLPARLHYSDSPRIMPVLLLPEEGWTINSRDWVEKHPKFEHGGQHGYDNQDKSMRATFIAAGPAFASHATLAPFANVHVYSLMAYLLNLHPVKTDGSINVFESVLVKSTEGPKRIERAPWRGERLEVASVSH
ncbi:MAG TPA: ectonucleotide pyrophosphatase/phosphodiesterase [Terriglobales bacterium]|nr:ectonucleotide pyrophosphatase/phosphodiesterase [Terriglobales bacterium]